LAVFPAVASTVAAGAWPGALAPSAL